MKFKICHGSTRIVVCIGSVAIKLPRFDRWRNFLLGLLANLQERDFSSCGWPELCPVIWAAPGGFLSLMKRARPMTEAEFEVFDWDMWARKSLEDDYFVPVEPKVSSFGWMDGRLVAVDYGN